MRCVGTGRAEGSASSLDLSCRRRSLGKGGRGDYTLKFQQRHKVVDRMAFSLSSALCLLITESIESKASRVMAKNTRKIKPANHGTRPASSKARKAKRAKVRT